MAVFDTTSLEDLLPLERRNVAARRAADAPQSVLNPFWLTRANSEGFREPAAIPPCFPSVETAWVINLEQRE
jgi:hypothetical protein